ncbi:MAG: hypothetical protein ABL974_22000, partial [Prosthecobacter sp.]
GGKLPAASRSYDTGNVYIAFRACWPGGSPLLKVHPKLDAPNQPFSRGSANASPFDLIMVIHRIGSEFIREALALICWLNGINGIV